MQTNKAVQLARAKFFFVVVCHITCCRCVRRQSDCDARRRRWRIAAVCDCDQRRPRFDKVNFDCFVRSWWKSLFQCFHQCVAMCEALQRLRSPFTRTMVTRLLRCVWVVFCRIIPAGFQKAIAIHRALLCSMIICLSLVVTRHVYFRFLFLS